MTRRCARAPLAAVRQLAYHTHIAHHSRLFRPRIPDGRRLGSARTVQRSPSVRPSVRPSPASKKASKRPRGDVVGRCVPRRMCKRCAASRRAAAGRKAEVKTGCEADRHPAGGKANNKTTARANLLLSNCDCDRGVSAFPQPEPRQTKMSTSTSTRTRTRTRTARTSIPSRDARGFSWLRRGRVTTVTSRSRDDEPVFSGASPPAPSIRPALGRKRACQPYVSTYIYPPAFAS